MRTALSHLVGSSSEVEFLSNLFRGLVSLTPGNLKKELASTVFQGASWIASNREV